MLKLGIVQLAVTEGDIENNTRKIEAEVKRHGSAGVDIVCFPELCVSGYRFEEASKLDETEFMAAAAKGYRTAVIAGVHRIENGLHYDAVCLWDENGRRLGEYRKIHLWASENGYFEHGSTLTVIPYKGWNIGLLLCADLGFPELSSLLAGEKGADVLVYSSAWAKGWEDLFVSCTKVRAAENQVYAVSVNRGSGSAEYCGNSTVAGPDGSTLHCLKTKEAAAVTVSLEKAEISRVRKEIPWTEMKQYALYERLSKQEPRKNGTRRME